MQILRLATALPENEFSTQELMETFPCDLPEGIKQNILNLGVSKRYLVSNPEAEGELSEKSLTDLCHEACGKALKKADLTATDVGCLISAYDVNPFLSPGLSQLLVPALDLDPYTSLVNVQGTASTAFPKALELAKNHLAANPRDTILVCVSGASSYWFQNQVRGLRDVMEISKISAIAERKRREYELRKWMATMQFFLFGDGVAAAVVTKKDAGLTFNDVVEVTNMNGKDYMAGYARLSTLNEPFKFGFHSHLDKEIPNLGAKYTALALKRLLGKNAEKTMKAIKKWAVHTGSEKILSALAERNEIDREKLKESHEVLRDCGNLAGASLPFILAKIVSTNSFSDGDMVLMLGYGWGFSASASMLQYKA